jgi:hypothetical protein
MQDQYTGTLACGWSGEETLWLSVCHTDSLNAIVVYLDIITPIEIIPRVLHAFTQTADKEFTNCVEGVLIGKFESL